MELVFQLSQDTCKRDVRDHNQCQGQKVQLPRTSTAHTPVHFDTHSEHS